MSSIETNSNNVWSEAQTFTLGEGEHAVLFLHGFSSTPRELKFLAQKCAALGTFCLAPRLPGHGTTPDDLSKIHWEEYLEFTQSKYISLRENFNKVSVVGLSFGGSLALHLAKSENIHSLCLLAPFLHPAHPKKWGIPIETLVDKLPDSFPSIHKDQVGIANPLERQKHLSYDQYSLVALKQFFHCVHFCGQDLESIQCPTLLLHSTADQTSAFQNSVEILQRISSRQKVLQAFSRSNHILTLDYDRIEVEQAALKWIMQ